jgi:anti-sigma factor RsiW
MNCPLETRDHAELLVAYSSRKLDAAKAAFVETHIQNCEACREVVRGQQAVWEALEAWEAEPISADFNRRLYQRIETQVTWWDRLLGPLRPLVLRKGVPLAAAAGLVLIAGVMLDRTAAPPPQSAGSASRVAAVEGLQPEQVVNALDEMQDLSRFNDLMKPETPESKM